MGIINVTPDSFSDGGRLLDSSHAIDEGVRLAEQGADLLDVGGESTRPGALPLAAGEELSRVLPVVEGLASRVAVPISIDTYKPQVADAALGAGASMVNDVSGLRYEPDLAAVVARRGVPIVLMHTRGRSRNMYEQAVVPRRGGRGARGAAGEHGVCHRCGRRGGTRFSSIPVLGSPRSRRTRSRRSHGCRSWPSWAVRSWWAHRERAFSRGRSAASFLPPVETGSPREPWRLPC